VPFRFFPFAMTIGIWASCEPPFPADPVRRPIADRLLAQVLSSPDGHPGSANAKDLALLDAGHLWMLVGACLEMRTPIDAVLHAALDAVGAHNFLQVAALFSVASGRFAEPAKAAVRETFRRVLETFVFWLPDVPASTRPDGGNWSRFCRLVVDRMLLEMARRPASQSFPRALFAMRVAFSRAVRSDGSFAFPTTTWVLETARAKVGKKDDAHARPWCRETFRLLHPKKTHADAPADVAAAAMRHIGGLSLLGPFGDEWCVHLVCMASEERTFRSENYGFDDVCMAVDVLIGASRKE
jgi:hypothetical protein